MDIQLDTLSFSDRLTRFLMGRKKYWFRKNNGKHIKMSKADRDLDIILWNIVKQGDVDLSLKWGDPLVKFGNNVRVKFDSLRGTPAEVEIGESRWDGISRSTAYLLTLRYKEEKERIEYEKQNEKTTDLKQKLYEGFVESKGL